MKYKDKLKKAIRENITADLEKDYNTLVTNKKLINQNTLTNKFRQQMGKFMRSSYLYHPDMIAHHLKLNKHKRITLRNWYNNYEKEKKES